MISSVALVLAVVSAAANGALFPLTASPYAYTGTPITYSYNPYPLVRSGSFITSQVSGTVDTKAAEPAELKAVSPIQYVSVQPQFLQPFAHQVVRKVDVTDEKPVESNEVIPTQYVAVHPHVVPQVVTYAAPQPIIQTPVVQKSQFHSQDELGSYHFGHYGGPSSRNEYRDHFGNVVGAYNYIDSDGKTQYVKYTAGRDGFNVAATNLPVAPEATYLEETPEVQAARSAFQLAFDKATSNAISETFVAPQPAFVPEEAAPAEVVPAETVPADAAPSEAVPADAAPAEEVPADVAPAADAPVEAVPAEAAPAEAAPTEAAPVEAASVEAASVEAAPAEAVPAETAVTAARKKRSTPADTTSVEAPVAPVAPVAPAPSPVVAVHGTPFHYPFFRTGLSPYSVLPTTYSGLYQPYQPYYHQPLVYTTGVAGATVVAPRAAELLQVVNNPGHSYAYTVLQK